MTRRAKKSLTVEELGQKAATALRRLEAKDDFEREALDLGASEIACAVADAWIAAGWDVWRTMLNKSATRVLGEKLNRLEEITRPSAMRKVRP